MAKKILEDHKKIGKVLQPPLLGIGTFTDTGWLEYDVPELIWIFLLLEKYGIDRGSRLSLDFGHITEPYITPKVKGGSGPMLISSYEVLNIDEKKEIVIELGKRRIITEIQAVFKPFNILYPESPMSFITENMEVENETNSSVYIEWYKGCLGNFYSKTDYISTIVLANVVNFLLSYDRIFVTESTKLPHLKEILNYPNTDESVRLASFIRTTVPMTFAVGIYDRDNSWINNFWKQNLKIEPCLI